LKGKLIVIEGVDGTGKSTQLKLLMERIQKEGFAVENIHFPKHEISFGKVVDAYLRGEFGQKENLSPEFVAMLYMTDFYESKKEMEIMLAEGKVIALSRFFSSTLTYQVALEKSDKETLWEWIKAACMRLPQPDLTIVLDVPQSFSDKLMDNANRTEEYKKGAKHDQHESDKEFQRAVRAEYERNIQKSGWKRVNCVENDSLLSPEKIHELVWNEAKKILK